MIYHPKCHYCNTQNKINLIEPINYYCCYFRCKSCKCNNIKDIRLRLISRSI